MHRSPTWAADYAEAQAKESYRRERSLNDVIERKNPHLRPTTAYAKGPIPAWHPRFGTETDYWSYRAVRERGKFNPTQRYP